MSKVIHLSNEAHAIAKDYCKRNGLRMSDWVASLIEEAIQSPQTRPEPAAPPPPEQPIAAAASTVARRKPLERLPEDAQKVRPIETAAVEEEVPAYAAPPFWARAQN